VILLTIHGAETRDGDHDGEENATEGAKESATEIQSDGITTGNGILRGASRPIAP